MSIFRSNIIQGRGLPARGRSGPRSPISGPGAARPRAAARRRAKSTSPAASCCRATRVALLDPGAPFLELSAARRVRVYDDEVPAAGIITGIGRVSGPRMRDRRQRRHGEGRHLLSADGEEASARAGDRAARTACPASISSIPAAPICRTRTRCFPTASISAASSTTRRTCRPQGIPQIAVVMGSCTAGGAYVPAMSDESIIVRNQGTIFLGGPPLVKAATGEVVTRRGARRRRRASAHLRRRRPYCAENDAHALAIARRIVGHLNRVKQPALRHRASRRSRSTIPRRSTASSGRYAQAL